MKNKWILFVILIMTLSCSGGRNNWFSQADRSEKNGTKVLLDRFGDIYPDAKVKIPYALFDNSDSLKIYGCYNVVKIVSLSSVFEMCDSLQYKIWTNQPIECFNQKWTIYQDSLLDSIASEINSNSGELPIVLKIHGYNNSFDEADTLYKHIDMRLSDSKYYSVEVYWDGLIGKSSWDEAQSNFPFISVTLRKLLNKFDKNKKVGIITHSSGGPIALGIFGNTFGMYKDSTTSKDAHKRWKKVKNDMDTIRISSNLSVNLVTIVPAASLNIFKKYKRSEIKQLSWISVNNKNDIAISKVLSCKVAGATCLGKVSNEEFCSVGNEIENRGVIDAGGSCGWFEKVFNFCSHSSVKYVEERMKDDVFDFLTFNKDFNKIDNFNYCVKK